MMPNFHPDAFFTTEQQARLKELMSRFHEACNAGQDLSPEEKED